MRYQVNLLLILLMLVSPAIAINLGPHRTEGIEGACQSLLVPLFMFICPLAFFHGRIKTYLYLLLPLLAITPLFLFMIVFFAIPPGFELIAFLLQTNPREASEAAGPFLKYLVPAEIMFVALSVLLIYRLPDKPIPLGQARAISAICIILLAVTTVHANELYRKNLSDITKYDLILKYDYPVSLLTGINEARIFLKKNNLGRAEHFRFHARKIDSLDVRQVYVLIIGESSRYDRWQVNGYTRPTSPRLFARPDLLSFQDVVAGAHYTWVSVPQIITRSSPENYDVQYREKSILAAFRESGFKTAWLSNQSDQDIFWSGTITLHAKTADISIFSPTYSPNLEFEPVHDGRLLRLLDSLLQADNKNLFVVMHTMGNHWDYSQRYPPDFDFFQPSGHSRTISPPVDENREAILNSYDNSIRYADFIIDSVISTVNARAAVSAVTFISDHGEDLFDSHPHQLDFHFRPSAATLRVPLFIWTSGSFKNIYPQKRLALEANLLEKIGTENIFYTVLDLANIWFDGFETEKSIASPFFTPSSQKVYGDDRQARPFKEIVEAIK